jgi:hypothetical protein
MSPGPSAQPCRLVITLPTNALHVATKPSGGRFPNQAQIVLSRHLDVLVRHLDGRDVFLEIVNWHEGQDVWKCLGGYDH